MTSAIGFYSTAEVARLVGIKRRTISNWKRRGIVVPSVRIQVDERSVEGYSYADLTILRLLSHVRERRIDFRSAAVALRHLCERLGPPSQGWADARVYFDGHKIYAERPDSWPVTSATDGGQTIAEVLFGALFPELRALDDQWSLVVPQRFRPYVMINPSIMDGQPVVRGTRIPTDMMLRLHREGVSTRQIISYYPNLDASAVERAIEYEEELDTLAAAA